MPKRTEEYWQKRFEQILINNEKLALDYEKEMASIYTRLEQDLQKELEAFYQRYAIETGLDLHEVKKQLNPKQLKNFKKQQELYLDTIHKLIEEGADLQAYEETLRKLSARAYVSKLQELQYNLNSQIMIATGQQQVALTHTLGEAYLQGYFESVYALQQGVGMGYAFTVPNNDDVLKILKTPWNGNNYSKSIWNNKAKLTNWLNTDLPRHFAAGAGVQQMSQDLVKKVETNYKNAVRLVRTETNYISNQSTMDAYEAQGVDRYQILATLDSRTSEICRDMDGNIYNTSDRKVAVNMPPFHVNCRTTTIPYFEDDEDDVSLTRIARDGDGFNYSVPANVNYKEWRKHYGNTEEIPDALNKLTKQTNDLSKDEKEALRSYTGNSFLQINQYLGGKTSKLHKDYKQMIPVLDKTLDKGVSPADLVVKRVADFDSLGMLDGKTLTEAMVSDKLIGRVLTNPAYMSTSLVEPQLTGRQVTMILDIPKGYKGVQYLAPVASQKHKHQYEMLIKRDASYEITDIDLSGKKPVIYAKLV